VLSVDTTPTASVVAVGTAANPCNLDVSGTLTTTALQIDSSIQLASDSTDAFQVKNAAGTEVVLDVDTEGLGVGIGTGSVYNTLQVAGNACIGSNYTADAWAAPSDGLLVDNVS
jgi:hypothetical protein